MKNIIYSIINLNIQEYNQITFKNKHHYFFGLLKSAIALRWGKYLYPWRKILCGMLILEKQNARAVMLVLVCVLSMQLNLKIFAAFYFKRKGGFLNA